MGKKGAANVTNVVPGISRRRRTAGFKTGEIFIDDDKARPPTIQPQEQKDKVWCRPKP